MFSFNKKGRLLSFEAALLDGAVRMNFKCTNVFLKKKGRLFFYLPFGVQSVKAFAYIFLLAK